MDISLNKTDIFHHFIKNFVRNKYDEMILMTIGIEISNFIGKFVRKNACVVMVFEKCFGNLSKNLRSDGFEFM